MDDGEFLSTVRDLMTEPRQVTATMHFRGEPGREAEAAQAWAFDWKYYFTRGVGEAPAVSYEDGIYTVTGLIQTTHPHDADPILDVVYGEYPTIDFVLDPGRQETLRDAYSRRGIWYDGRDRG